MTEALLFGQQGFFQQDIHEPYFLRLKAIYLQLKDSFSFSTQAMPLYYFRMRPNNFPTIRLAQLAQWLSSVHHLVDYLHRSPAE